MNRLRRVGRHGLSDAARFFRESIGRCGSEADLARLLADAGLELGFDHVALLSQPITELSMSRRIRIDNYPEEWVSRVARRSLCSLDPVHQASQSTFVGFSWSSIGRLVRMTCDQRQVMDEARRYGLRHGFTVPLRAPGHPAASCSFVARKAVSLTQERMMCAEVVALHGYAAALRIAAPDRQRPRPSRRERQCIQLVAQGKSDWEIGRILGLSTETVRGYLKQARARFDVVSRSQLVALALRDGQIDFE